MVTYLLLLFLTAMHRKLTKNDKNIKSPSVGESNYEKFMFKKDIT